MKKQVGVLMYETSRSKGQELVAQRMVHYLRKLGHDAYLITSVYHDGREVADEALMGDKGYVVVDDKELGIPIIRVGSLVSRWPPRRIVFKDMVHMLERIVNDFKLNVLITHSTLWNGPEEVAKFVEWRRNIRALGGFQDPLVFCHMSHFQEPSPKRYSLVERSFRMAWNRLSLRTILRVANLILVVTPDEKEEKVQMGAPASKCVLFPGGVDDDSFLQYASSSTEELSQRLKLAPDVKLVSYIGTIEERKNPEAVLEVADILKENRGVHFVIAGRAESEYADAIKARCGQMPNVSLLGEISEKEKVQLTKVSYLNILLSRMEALGLTQLEFMFEGVPVITSGVGGQAWLVKDGEEGVRVNGPDDVEGAARAITDLVSEPSKREKLAVKAKEKGNAFTLTKLVGNLDAAITKELEKESGLSGLPSEVRSTMVEPELVEKTWSQATQKVIATNKRLFIQQGRISRRTLEIPYDSINSIEHIRRYHWKTLTLGALFSVLLLIQHYAFPLLSRSLTSVVDQLIERLLPSGAIPQFLIVVPFLPIVVAALYFLFEARRGFALHGPTMKPVYLPQSLAEVVKHVRSVKSQIPATAGAPTSQT